MTPRSYLDLATDRALEASREIDGTASPERVRALAATAAALALVAIAHRVIGASRREEDALDEATASVARAIQAEGLPGGSRPFPGWRSP